MLERLRDEDREVTNIGKAREARDEKPCMRNGENEMGKEKGIR